MDYSEENIQVVLQNWAAKGFEDLLILDKGMFYSVKKKCHFAARNMVESERVHFSFTDTGAFWSMYALVMADGCYKGIFVYSHDFYDTLAMSSEIYQLLGLV